MIPLSFVCVLVKQGFLLLSSLPFSRYVNGVVAGAMGSR